MIRLVTLPFCTAVMLDVWNASPSRHFAAYRCSGSYRWLLGHPVIDEFATISSPIFLAPRSLLGKIYNAGISLGHQRDPEMGIDLGWPPLCVGLDAPAPELPSNWEARLLEALAAKGVPGEGAGDTLPIRRGRFGEHEVECLKVGEASIFVTSAPLLPKQLGYLCEAGLTPLVVAVSVGNRLERVSEGEPRSVTALSQERLIALYGVVEGLSQ
ncbi:MAG: hypothetical protein WBO74_01655 [Thermoanaerobaculia bacterium]